MGHCQHIRAAPQSRPVRASRKKSTLCVAASLVDFLFLFVSETVMNQPEDKIQAITALSLTEKIEVQGTTVPFTNILASFENHKLPPHSIHIQYALYQSQSRRLQWAYSWFGTLENQGCSDPARKSEDIPAITVAFFQRQLE